MAISTLTPVSLDLNRSDVTVMQQAAAVVNGDMDIDMDMELGPVDDPTEMDMGTNGTVRYALLDWRFGRRSIQNKTCLVEMISIGRNRAHLLVRLGLISR